MRLLVDANIFLEIILEQERADEAKSLLTEVTTHDFFLSDYALHSIGTLLFRQGRHEVYRQFLQDMMFGAGMQVITLLPDDMEAIIDTATTFYLDFDDAYQYVAAEKYGLALVSFDSDFDHTARGRKTPANLLRS